MSRKISQEVVDFVILAYPLVSNVELSEFIGYSVAWLEKTKQKYNLKKLPQCHIPGQEGPIDLTGLELKLSKGVKGEIKITYYGIVNVNVAKGISTDHLF